MLAPPLGGAEVLGVVLHGPEDRLDGLPVQAVDLFPSPPLDEHQATPFEGLQVMGDHALLLLKLLGDRRDVLRPLPQALKDGEPRGVRERREEPATGLAQVMLQPRSPNMRFSSYEEAFIRI